MSKDAKKPTEKAGPSAHTAALHSIDEVRELLAGAALEDLEQSMQAGHEQRRYEQS